MPKLLIVDDEPDVREFAANFFRKRGALVSSAIDGRSAFAEIARDLPDLILLDIRMEGMSGIDILRKLRSEGNSVKVIMVSGMEDEVVIAEAKRLGVLAFIHKPLILDELHATVMKELVPCP